jgi:hypothetical protein
MNGRSQMQGGNNWIFPKDIYMQTGPSETFIGWKSGQTTFVPLWVQMEGAWIWTPYVLYGPRGGIHKDNFFGSLRLKSAG